MAIEDLFSSPDYLRQLIGEEQYGKAQNQAFNRGLIDASLAALAGSSQTNKLGQIIAASGQAGLKGYEGTMDRTLSDIAKGMQIQDLKRKQDLQQAQKRALQAATTTMQPAVVPEGQTLRDDQGMLTMGAEEAKAVPGKFNADIYKTYALRLGVDPKDISSTVESLRGKMTTVKPGEVVLGEDMKAIYTAPQEAKGQLVDTPQGMMIFDPVTRKVTPAVDAQGQPLMGEKGKAPPKFTGQVGYIKNLKTSVADYINDIKNTDPRYVFPGSSKAAELQTKYSDLMMQMKDAYGLGALQAPDLVVMNKIITDPVSMAGRYKGKEALETQLNTINSVFSNREKGLYETYKQPVPKDLQSLEPPKSPQEALGITIPQGVVVRRKI
jgi:hypothetical protein